MDRLAPRCITRKITSRGKLRRRCAAAEAVLGTVAVAAQRLVRAVAAAVQVDALALVLPRALGVVPVVVLELAPDALGAGVDARVVALAAARVVLGDNG